MEKKEVSVFLLLPVPWKKELWSLWVISKDWCLFEFRTPVLTAPNSRPSPHTFFLKLKSLKRDKASTIRQSYSRDGSRQTEYPNQISIIPIYQFLASIYYTHIFFKWTLLPCFQIQRSLHPKSKTTQDAVTVHWSELNAKLLLADIELIWHSDLVSGVPANGRGLELGDL